MSGLKIEIDHRISSDDYCFIQLGPAASEYEESTPVSHALNSSIAILIFISIRMVYTSETIQGQVYVPAVNWLRE